MSALQRDARGVVTYAFDDPATRNALSLAVLVDLDSTLATLASDSSLRVLVLTGVGPVFSSGADRTELGDPVKLARATRLVRSVLERMDSLSVPVVCRVNGSAFGAGLAMVAAADVSVAVPAAQFGFPEVRFGFVAGPAAAACLRRVGETAALDLFLTGRQFDAAEARRMGLVSSVVSSDLLDEQVEERIGDLLLGDAAAVSATKKLVRRLGGSTLGQGLAAACEDM